MAKITDIKKQKRRDIRFSVFLDGRYAFALTDLELSTIGLRVGQDLTDDEVRQYQDSAEEAKAYALALRFLSYRPRSVREMRDHLRRKQVDSEDVDVVVSRMLKAGLLDDVAFAEGWVRNRQALRPRSRRMLEQELIAKGISRDEIAVALGEVDGESELESLVELMERKRRLPQYSEQERLLGYFARQGYTYDLLQKALQRLETKEHS